MKRQWQRALITGASSGIGREMTRQLAESGIDLVVVARDAERLAALAEEVDVDVEVLSADLSVPADLAGVAARLGADDDPVDLLVNNAGLGFSADFVDVPAERSRLMVDVNVAALHELCLAAAPAMIRRGVARF